MTLFPKLPPLFLDRRTTRLLHRHNAALFSCFSLRHKIPLRNSPSARRASCLEVKRIFVGHRALDHEEGHSTQFFTAMWAFSALISTYCHLLLLSRNRRT